MNTKSDLCSFEIHVKQLAAETVDNLRKHSDEDFYVHQLELQVLHFGDPTSNPSITLEDITNACHVAFDKIKYSESSHFVGELLVRASILKDWNWEIRYRKSLAEREKLEVLEDDRIKDTEAFYM